MRNCGCYFWRKFISLLYVFCIISFLFISHGAAHAKMSLSSVNSKVTSVVKAHQSSVDKLKKALLAGNNKDLSFDRRVSILSAGCLNFILELKQIMNRRKDILQNFKQLVDSELSSPSGISAESIEALYRSTVSTFSMMSEVDKRFLSFCDNFLEKVGD